MLTGAASIRRLRRGAVSGVRRRATVRQRRASAVARTRRRASGGSARDCARQTLRARARAGKPVVHRRLGITAADRVEHARAHVHRLFTRLWRTPRPIARKPSDLRKHRATPCGPRNLGEVLVHPIGPPAVRRSHVDGPAPGSVYPQVTTSYTQPRRPGPSEPARPSDSYVALDSAGDEPDPRPDAAGSTTRRRTGRSSGSPCRRSSRWSPSRCSCSPTRRSSATSAPRSWPGSASPARSSRRRSGCASSWPTAPPPRSPAGSAPATSAARWPRASTGSGWRCSSASLDHGRRACSLAGWLVGLFGAGPGGRRARHDVPAAGPSSASRPLLVMLAATGVLRGLQDTRTPLVVAVAGNLPTSSSTSLLVYGLGPRHRRLRDRHRPGPAGLRRGARRGRRPRPRGARARAAPAPAGVGRAAHAGVALVVRTLTLRASPAGDDVRRRDPRRHRAWPPTSSR